MSRNRDKLELSHQKCTKRIQDYKNLGLSGIQKDKNFATW